MKEEEQGKGNQGKANQGKANQGKANQGKANQGKANQEKAEQGKENQGKENKGKDDKMIGRDKRNIWKSGAAALVCGMALTLFSGTAAAEGQPDGAVGTASDSGITVTLATDKQVYNAGEEIHYTFTIENANMLSVVKGAEFTYSNTDGLTETVEGSAPASFPDIQPGETCVVSGTLTGDPSLFPAVAGSAGRGDADGSGRGNGGSGRIWIPVLVVAAALLAAAAVFFWRKKKKGGGTGGNALGALLLLGLLLPLGLTGDGLLAQAAGAGGVKLRPYVKFDYAGQEVMIRAVMEFNIQQKRWVVDSADRKQNKRITCHDPSIFKDFDGTYYVLGTHITGGSSRDLIDWTSLDGDIQAGYSKETRDQVKAWNDDDKAGSWLGYLWAPDIIYNTAMEKYCVYLSANGDYWKSNIVLLTADSVTGPYEYAGSIVYGGFTAADFGQTDAPRVLGTDEIPERYVKNGIANKKWGDMWPNCIDPCVFYDDDGRLWMSYGSWSGGIFLLALDSETGLRDYSVTYDTDIHSDAYFGKKIAGGAYVSGEASYIQKVGDYYYLFISYGNLEAAGGYNVRVFRSERPDGDYVDALGNSPLYDNYVFNYNQSVGVRLMGGYKWRNFNFGQVAQGHNSAFVDDDGRAYIVYHTRTTDGSEGHYVKVHQLFQTKEGWLVAAPYRTTGEKLKNGGYTLQEVAGAYEIILHELEIDYKNKEVKSPGLINLNEDGTISGDYTGVWELEPGTSYIRLQFNGVSYSGVTLEMTVENTVFDTMVFTALGDDQVTLWGSRMVEQ